MCVPRDKHECRTGLGFDPDCTGGPFPPGYRAPQERRSASGASFLRRAGLTPEVIADPEERLSVRSQITLLDQAAVALKDDKLGFTLARIRSARNRAAVLRHGVFADLGRRTKAGCSIQPDYQRSPGGPVSRGEQIHNPSELLWRSAAHGPTSN